MALEKTPTNKKRTFGKPTAMKFTRWVPVTNPETNETTYQLGDVTVDLASIVADSSSLEQGDPTTENIESEFTDTPLETVTTSGDWTFTTECIDFQNIVLKELYGCQVSDDGNAVIFPKQAENMYCMIHIEFGKDKNDVVLPFVAMASKATLSQMKSSVAKGTITGTCQNATMLIGASIESDGSSGWRFKDNEIAKVGDAIDHESAVFYIKHGKPFYVKDGNTKPSTVDNIIGYASEQTREATE